MNQQDVLKMFSAEMQKMQRNTHKAQQQTLETSQAALMDMFQQVLASTAAEAPVLAPVSVPTPAAPQEVSIPAQPERVITPSPVQQPESIRKTPVTGDQMGGIPLHLSCNKDTSNCPSDSICQTKKSAFCPTCGVAEMKKLALSVNGEIIIEVKQDPKNFKFSFDVYLDQQLIGFVIKIRENKTLITELEKYAGRRVAFHAVQKPSKTLDPNSVFTNLIVTKIGPLPQSEGIKKDAPSPSGSLGLGALQVPTF